MTAFYEQFMTPEARPSDAPPWGLYEYCGIQRSGKSTLMTKDLVTKILPWYSPEDIAANYRIRIPGIKCMSTEDLIAYIFYLKTAKARNKVILMDEVGQFLMARSYKDKEQTGMVTFAWQMPKRGILFMYGSNPGNSADVILRDATWVTILPHYYRGPTRDDDYIRSSVIFNWDCQVLQGVTDYNLVPFQDLFDTNEPIE